MKRICHITSAHDSTDVRIFYKECSSLAAAGYDCHLVASGESREENGVHIHGIGAAPGGRIERMTAFARKVYLAALALDCDIYHFHDPELLPYGLKLARKGKKVVFDSHENHAAQMASKNYLPSWFAKLLSAVYKAYETYCVKHFDAVIIPCTFGGKNIFDGRAKRTVFIENYPKLDEFISFDDIPEEERIASEICYTGSITEGNGIDVLTAAAGELGRQVLLAGEFDSEAFREKILSRRDAVQFLGWVNRQTMRRIYAGGKIGVCLSLDDGQYYLCDSFGVKVHEYMLAGLPVLVSDSPFEKMMIDTYNFGLYADPADKNAVKMAIDRLLSDPEWAKQLGQNGRKAAVEQFNWGTQERTLLGLYTELGDDFQ